MTVKDLTLKFITQPANLEMGAGKLAARFKVTKEDIYEAKAAARKLLHGAEIAELHDIVAKQEDKIARYLGSETTAEGSIRKFESTRPLTPNEIKELVGADGITTVVSRVWDKLQPNGIWTYSINIAYKVEDFYNSKELKEKLAEIMPDLTPLTTSVDFGLCEDALIILIADDHAGAVNTTNIFGQPEYTYEERLLKISQEVKRLKRTFEEVHVVSLGDQLNGFNAQTTRGGHEVKSLSNKEQFDLYTTARIKFYNDLFSSGVSENYFVHDVENSNHSGFGFSYMANMLLEMYLENKFPTVVRKSYHSQLGDFTYGEHIVVIGHGKDEKFQTRPMPAVLNDKTDLYLSGYLTSQGYINGAANVTFYKGDLHQHGIQNGQFGRYINVASVAGNSDYGDANFGNTKGGALLEILEKDSYRITSKAIWF